MKEIISEAINLRKPIEFEYVKEGKIHGKRIGNPHIIFSGHTKEGDGRTWLHLVQTDGVSDTLCGFPDWRMFIAEHICKVQILRDYPSFEIFRGYNSDSDVYLGTQIIAQI